MDQGPPHSPSSARALRLLRSRRPAHLTSSLPSSSSEPDLAQAIALEKQLQHAAAEGNYLILTVEPSYLERAQEELVARFDVEVCDLDEILLEALRAEAERLGADWNVVLAADIGRQGGPGGLWILAPASDHKPLPTINGVPIPITNSNQHRRLTSAWLRNEHQSTSTA